MRAQQVGELITLIEKVGGRGRQFVDGRQERARERQRIRLMNRDVADLPCGIEAGFQEQREQRLLGDGGGAVVSIELRGPGEREGGAGLADVAIPFHGQAQRGDKAAHKSPIRFIGAL